MACGAVSLGSLSPRTPKPFAPFALSSCPSSSSASFSCLSFAAVPLPKIRATRARVRARKAGVPMPPLDPSDPFLSMLDAAAADPDFDPLASASSGDPDMPPYLELFTSMKRTATRAQAARTVSYREGRDRPSSPPPDLPSILFDQRIVYIGMPLVSIVSELVIAELIYLQWDDPKAPIYFYINSTGTTRDDGEPVALDSEGFAIYDTMMLVKNEIHTVAVGAAMGHACLLLAAGKKGRRFMMPNAKAMIHQPRVRSSGQMQASDVLIRAKEVKYNRDTLVELLAKHTGNSVDKVSKVMENPFYMDAIEAKDFGVIDKVLWTGQEDLKEEVLSYRGKS